MSKRGGITIEVVKVFLMSFIAILLVFVAGYKFIYVNSDQAFINAKLTAVRAPISGIVNFSECNVGAAVGKGQQLVEVYDPLYANSESNSQYNSLLNLMDGVENEIGQNELVIRRYEADYERFSRLKESGGVSKRDFEEVENKLAVLRATVDNEKKQLEHLRQRFEAASKQLELLKSRNIESPCAGVIWAILAKDGEHVNMGDELLQTVNPDDVWVDAFFSERYAAVLRPGMMVTVSALGSKDKWDGEIVFIRGGSGRVMYNSAVEIPPRALSQRLVSVRVKVDWRGKFSASEFYGVGRSMLVSWRRS